jgi:hypothetical protein
MDASLREASALSLARVADCGGVLFHRNIEYEGHTGDEQAAQCQGGCEGCEFR